MRISQGGNKHDYGSKERVNFGGRVAIGGKQIVSDVTFSAAPGAANVTEVTITVRDGAGNAIAEVHALDVYLSDAATGAGLTATTASGTVTVKAGSGTVLGTHTTKKALRVLTDVAGVFVLEITDTAKTLFYVCAVLAVSGRVIVSEQLATEDYG